MVPPMLRAGEYARPRDDSTLYVRGSKRTGAVSPPSPPRNRAPFQRPMGATVFAGRLPPRATSVQAHRRQAIGRIRTPGTSSAKLPTGARIASTNSVSSRSRSSPAASTMKSSCCQETTGQPLNCRGDQQVWRNDSNDQPHRTTAAAPFRPRNGWTSIPSILAGRSPMILPMIELHRPRRWEPHPQPPLPADDVHVRADDPLPPPGTLAAGPDCDLPRQAR